MQFPELEQLLRETFIFSRVPADQIRHLEGAFHLHLFQAGETIVTRGQPADGWSIVCSGKARVLARSDATSVAPMILERGDAFGERSLIESGPSPYTVRAESGLTLLALTRGAFDRVTGPLPDLVAELHSRIARNAEFEFFKRLRIFSHLPPDPEPTFAFGSAVALPRPFQLRPLASRRAYDVTPNGKFVGLIPVGQPEGTRQSASQIQVVLNWFEELKARVPTK